MFIQWKEQISFKCIERTWDRVIIKTVVLYAWYYNTTLFMTGVSLWHFKLRYLEMLENDCSMWPKHVTTSYNMYSWLHFIVLLDIYFLNYKYFTRVNLILLFPVCFVATSLLHTVSYIKSGYWQSYRVELGGRGVHLLQIKQTSLALLCLSSA